MVAIGFALAACAGQEPDESSLSQAILDPSDFVLPMLSAQDRAAIVHTYDALDPTAEVPRGLLEDAIVYFDFNKPLIPKQTYFIVVDFSLYSGKDRFWMVNTITGAVEAHKVAHGDGSDPDNNGYATLFSNVSGSHKSSLGFYLTGEIYDGTHPHSMRLDGLSADGSPNGMANTNVRPRLVVVHEASYVDDANTGAQGRSNGCLALDPDIEANVVDRIHDGTLIYAATSPLNPPVGAGDGGPCGTIAPAGGTIDDTDGCFAARGPATGLHRETTVGLNSNLIWTRATAVATEQDYADWTLEFMEAGRYKLEAYTATAFAQSKQARYEIVANGAAHEVTIDQTAADGFQSLGEFEFAQGGDQFVHLGDNTGETTKPQLVFDALRITRVGPTDDADAPADAPGLGPDGDDDGDESSGCSTSGGNASALLGFALLALRRRKQPRR
jgi:hypothetical protein